MLSQQFSDPSITAGIKLHPAIARGLRLSEDPRAFASPYFHHGRGFRFVNPAELHRFQEFDRIGNEPKYADPENEIQKLMESIKHGGLQEPLQLSYNITNNLAHLSEGHHRLAAATRLGLTSVPVVGNVTHYDSPSGRGTLINPISSVQRDPFGWYPKTVDPQQIIRG